jgi:DNA-binding IclR family transcriptional regulator
VLDVVELLASPAGASSRLVDVARELDIAQGTAHAILAVLCDRGWVSRDPVDRTFSLGPALGVTAARADGTRPLAHAARTAALRLAEELDVTTSVTELAGEVIVLTFFGGGGTDPEALPPGERIPFAAPFGPGFAAWEPPADRRTWIERGAAKSPALAERLEAYLDETRERGYSVERMSPALVRTAQLMRSLEQDPWSGPVRRIIDDALGDVAAAGLEPDEGTADERPVTALSAPVFDRHGRAVLNVGVHPFRPVPGAELAAMGGSLASATEAIGGPPPRW